MNTPQRYTGRASWLEFQEFVRTGVERVTRYSCDDARATLRSESILDVSIQFEHVLYTAVLAFSDDSFDATFVAHHAADKWSIHAAGRVFKNENGVFLFGTWTEKDKKNTWFVDLIPLTRFNDPDGFLDPASFIPDPALTPKA